MSRCMRLTIKGTILFLIHVIIPINSPAQNPPFVGTIFVDPDIITSSDTTSYQSVSNAGQGFRTMFDRRVNDWVNVNAYLFNASFDDGLSAEIQVNPEFGSVASALAEAQKYGEVIGRIPTALRVDVQTVWIHKGVEPFGGGNNNLLIHTGQADLYIADGILEETFVHEASHTSLDADHASSAGWLAAQVADDLFISSYARDNPDREDIAESFLLYLAVRFRSDRITQSLKDLIEEAMPNRIAYFDQQSFDMHPVYSLVTGVNDPATIKLPNTFALLQNYPNPFNPPTTIEYSIPHPEYVSIIIYNLIGEEVTRLVDGKQKAGNHTTTWDASKFASGIYFYRLQVGPPAGGFIQTRKMLLLK